MTDLHPLFTRLAEQHKDEAADRLRRGRGVHGPLRGKKESDGKPLGGRLPATIRGGSVEVHADGYTITHRSKALEAFHEGTTHQPARPVLGLDAEQRLAAASDFGEDLRLQLRREGVAR